MVSRVRTSPLLSLLLLGSSAVPLSSSYQGVSDNQFSGKKVEILYSTNSGPRSSNDYVRPDPVDAKFLSDVEMALEGQRAYSHLSGVFMGNDKKSRVGPAVNLMFTKKNLITMDYIVLADRGLGNVGELKDEHRNMVYTSSYDKEGKIKFERLGQK
ncbi:MAG: hypothetical protein AABX23_01165 [Nanoarchaeota archaeon]